MLYHLPAEFKLFHFLFGGRLFGDDFDVLFVEQFVVALLHEHTAVNFFHIDKAVSFAVDVRHFEKTDILLLFEHFKSVLVKAFCHDDFNEYLVYFLSGGEVDYSVDCDNTAEY